MATNVHLAIRVNLRCLKNGSNGSTMSQHLWIDTKIKSLTCLEPNLLFNPFYLTFTGQNVAILATQVNLVWKWSQSISHAQKTGDRHQNQVCCML